MRPPSAAGFRCHGRSYVALWAARRCYAWEPGMLGQQVACRMRPGRLILEDSRLLASLRAPLRRSRRSHSTSSARGVVAHGLRKSVSLGEVVASGRVGDRIRGGWRAFDSTRVAWERWFRRGRIRHWLRPRGCAFREDPSLNPSCIFRAHPVDRERCGCVVVVPHIRDRDPPRKETRGLSTTAPIGVAWSPWASRPNGRA